MIVLKIYTFFSLCITQISYGTCPLLLVYTRRESTPPPGIKLYHTSKRPQENILHNCLSILLPSFSLHSKSYPIQTDWWVDIQTNSCFILFPSVYSLLQKRTNIIISWYPGLYKRSLANNVSYLHNPSTVFFPQFGAQLSIQ
jgi:hypothetical protein